MATSPTYCTMISRTLALKKIKNGKTQRGLSIKDKYAGSLRPKQNPAHSNSGTMMASKLTIKATRVRNSKPESPRRGFSEERKSARKIMASASTAAPERMMQVAKACSSAKGKPAKKRLTREKNSCSNMEIIPELSWFCDTARELCAVSQSRWVMAVMNKAVIRICTIVKIREAQPR